MIIPASLDGTSHGWIGCCSNHIGLILWNDVKNGKVAAAEIITIGIQVPQSEIAIGRAAPSPVEMQQVVLIVSVAHKGMTCADTKTRILYRLL